jgi:ElaB/YqjD/DUF883 family membrane-anchored ribosome-binding protein
MFQQRKEEAMETTIRRGSISPTDDVVATATSDEASVEVGHSGNGLKLRAKLDAAVEKAKAACERLQDQTTAAAKATDRSIREHPYQAIGVAFGLGVLVGVFAMWKRRD